MRYRGIFNFYFFNYNSVSDLVAYIKQGLFQVVSDLNLKLDELNSFKDSLSQQLSEIRSTLNNGKYL